MDKKLLFIDVESDGLYGSFLTVAIIVTDSKGNEIERAYYGIKRENMHITERWVEKNVIPKLGVYEECETEEELLHKTWDLWQKYRDSAYVVCDVGYPVEVRLWERCTRIDLKENIFKAPFPLVDISSMLLVKGIDPLIDREELLGIDKDMEHNAMYDVETTVRLWQFVMEECNGTDKE